MRAAVIVPLPPSKRTRALLGYLVASGASHLRQSLCDLLWDGPDDPRGALRWSLSKLRGVTDDELHPRLHADREHVAFLAHGAEIDIAQAQALLDGGVADATIDALEAAAALLQGEFLDGLDLPACHRFHHWCMSERERYGIMRRQVLGALAERLRDDPARALPHARALVSADPLSESAHATLIQILTRSGRHQDAELHFQRAAELLQHEVGAEAAETLRAAWRAARRRQRTATQPPSASPSPVMPVVRVEARRLVGRDAEWRRIVEITRALSAPHPLLLFLGEAGIGKTRALEALAAAARERGARVALGRCFEAEAVHPFGCFSDALRELPETLLPEVFQGETPRGTDATPPSTGESDRGRLLAHISTFVAALAQPAPFVLVLDDLQWIDEASAALLHFLVRRAIPGLLLAGSARQGELDDNPWLKRVLQSLARDGLVERRTLEPLSCDDIARLTGLDAASDDAAATFRHSGGNPLIALELARAQRDGANPYGQSLEALIAERTARLSHEERGILVWAAAFGRAVRPELLAACLSLGEAAVMAGVERLVRHGLLRPMADGQLDFAHDLVRQGVYRLQSQPYRRMLHRQIARVLSAVVDETPDLYGDLVHQAGLAEDHGTAARACIAAAERCLRLFAAAQALATVERGLAHLEHLPAGRDRVRQLVKLLELKTFASAGAGALDIEGQLAALEHATDAAVMGGLYGEAVAALHARSWLYWHVNDSAGAERMTLQAEKISRTADLATRCQQLANTSRCLLDVEASIPRALALLTEAEVLAEAHNFQFAELEWARALAARWRGELDPAAACMTRALGFARMAEDHRREAECLVWLATIKLERGDLDGVEAACDEGERVIDQVDRSRLPVIAAFRALAGQRRADPDASARLSAAIAGLRAVDDKWHLAYALNCQAASAIARGDRILAELAGAEALANARIMQRPTEIAVAAASLSVAAALSGDAKAAAAWLEEGNGAGGGHDLAARGRVLLREAESAIVAVAGRRHPGESGEQARSTQEAEHQG